MGKKTKDEKFTWKSWNRQKKNYTYEQANKKETKIKNKKNIWLTKKS